MTETKTDDWDTLDWFSIDREVFRIQCRIFKASRDGDRRKMLELQRLLLRSRSARLLAVRKAAQDSKGKHTPGVDGQKSLTTRQKMVLAGRLTLKWDTLPVRRTRIPKPGSQESRPLGIPTIADRAHQHLLNLALEPQAEARYSLHQYGFRRGRNAHDAILACRRWILRSPQWALRIDIEKFFDRLDHEAILKKLDTFPAMERAIRRILKSGVLEGEVLTDPESGTPQGGPLSPLLANTALLDLEKAIHDEFPPGRRINDVKVGKRPRIVIYADDATVLHPDKHILEAVRDFIATWLHPLGLSLNAEKTTMTHSLEKHAGAAGFEFLGVHIQQFRTSKHTMRSHAYYKGIFTHIRPSMKSMKRIRSRVKQEIQKAFIHKRHNASQTHRENQGGPTLQELLIFRLNPILRGWANYHRPHNAKKAFSRIDHDIHHMLRKWAIRAYPSKSRSWLARALFNRTGHNTPWNFSSSRTDKPVDLLKVASISIQRHIPVKAEKSYYDGDTLYWAKRSGKYPGLRYPISKRIKQQSGKCAACSQAFTQHGKIVLQQFERPDTYHTVLRAVHHSCVSSQPGAEPFQPSC